MPAVWSVGVAPARCLPPHMFYLQGEHSMMLLNCYLDIYILDNTNPRSVPTIVSLKTRVQLSRG